LTAARGAERIAQHLAEEQLATCVNIIPDITSVYKWKEALERVTEYLMILKTTEDRLPQLIHRIKELHPYEVPEVIAFAIEHGYPPYLEWIVSQTRGDPGLNKP